MRILYHHRTMGRGAEGLHILHVVRALEKRGHIVDISSPPGIDPRMHAGSGPVDMTEVRSKGTLSFWKSVSKYAPQILFELIEILYNFWALPKLLYMHWQNKYDLIYERHAMFLMAGAWFSRITKVPLILEVNEVTGPKRAREHSLKWLTLKIEQSVFPSCRKIYAVSSYLAGSISQRGGAEKVEIVPNCIDPEDYARQFIGSAVRKKLGIGNEVVIGFAGWFSDWDRLDFFVESFSKLLTRVSEPLKLMLIGDGPVLKDLRNQVKTLGIESSVILTGAVPRAEVLDYLDAIDIAVIPCSNDYGSPMVMFEFMALGKSVVAPDLKPILDVIQSGVNGLIFKNLDGEDLVSKLSELLNHPDLKANVAETGKSLVFSSHTWDAVAQRVERCCD